MRAFGRSARGRAAARRRRGVTLPLIAVCVVGLCGFVALAVDVGRMSLARLQCQCAADVAATAGARSLNGIWLRVGEVPLERGGQFQCGEQRFLIRIL